MKQKTKVMADLQDTRLKKSLSRFLLFTIAILFIYVPLNVLNGASTLAVIQSIVIVELYVLFILLKKGFSLLWVKHGIGGTALVVFVSLLFNPSVANTGIYWIFGYPLIVFFFLGVRTGLQWVAIYFISILLGVLLAYLGYLHLYFSYTQVAVAMIELFFFSVLGYFFVSDNERAEQNMQSHVQYLQSIERIEQVVHADLDMDESMGEVLQVLLDDFQASRAWLLTPCDLETDTWSIPFERCVPEFPGAFDCSKSYPVNDDVRQIFTAALQSNKPVCYESPSSIPDEQGMLRTFSIQSQMMIILRPDSHKTWLLGLHQCDQQRQYTELEQRLFHDIARRIEDALNQKLLYRDLKQASQKAEAANHAKSEFLSVMSHELRTPIHGIIGLQSLIASDQQQLSSEQQEHLMLAQQAAKSLQDLVNDILNLSKVESGTVELTHQAFSLKACLQDSVAPFIIACRDKQIALHIDFHQLPSHIMGDELRLRQVLINLIGNAVKFTHQGYVKVLVKASQKSLIFQVCDTGIGIDSLLLPSIFEPFVQANSLMDTQHQGTGLGTAIAKRFVELMGGKISVTSSLGKGSCFEVRLPLHSGDEKRISWHEDVSLSHAILAKAADDKPFYDKQMQQLRVLLAEDDSIAQRIAIKRFKRAGIALDVANDGAEAWQMLQRNTYDVLLSDIRMPNMDGLTLTQKIRQHEREQQLATLPIIGLSAHAVDEVIEDCYSIGMDAFLAKPVSPDNVLKMIKSIMLDRQQTP